MPAGVLGCTKILFNPTCDKVVSEEDLTDEMVVWMSRPVWTGQCRRTCVRVVLAEMDYIYDRGKISVLQ